MVSVEVAIWMAGGVAIEVTVFVHVIIVEVSEAVADSVAVEVETVASNKEAG